MLRAATPADIPAIITMGREMHDESPRYAPLSYNRAKVGALAERLIATGSVFVTARDGELTGMMAGFVVECWFGDDKIASDFVLFVRPAYRTGRAALLLVRAFEQWAKAQGAVHISPGSTTGVNPEAAASFYSKLGYRVTGNTFFKEAKDV